MDRFDFLGKKVIVTGASSGLGRETAIMLSQMDAEITIIARREEELKKTLSRMKEGNHSYMVVDLSDFDNSVDAIKAVVKKDGRKIDCVAHCAAIAEPIPLRAIAKKSMDRTFETNFYSFAAILKCASSKKLFNDNGSIVTVSSYVVSCGQAGNGVYAASKGAMDAMMKTAAKELRGRGIRVNSILPFGIRTEMIVNQAVRNIEGDSIDTLPDYLPRPENIASVIVALLSNSMRCVSGVALDVDEAKDKG